MKNYTKILLLMLFLTSSFSCKDDDDCCTPLLCGVENPAENLPWLKAMIESWKSNNQELYTYMYVLQGKYLGQTVFITSNCCPFCSSIPLIYNCEGDSIDYKNLINITEQKVIWKPLDSLCNF